MATPHVTFLSGQAMLQALLLHTLHPWRQIKMDSDSDVHDAPHQSSFKLFQTEKRWAFLLSSIQTYQRERSNSQWRMHLI